MKVYAQIFVMGEMEIWMEPYLWSNYHSYTTGVGKLFQAKSWNHLAPVQHGPDGFSGALVVRAFPWTPTGVMQLPASHSLAVR